MKLIKVLSIVFLFVSIGNTIVLAQTTNELAKQNKELMKQMDKEYKTFTYPCIEENGYWYFKSYGKKSKLGVFDKSGHVIVPTEYDFIEYYPGQKEGFYKNRTNERKIWYPNIEPSFIATIKDKKTKVCTHTIYKLDGTTPIKNLTGKLYSYGYNGYFEIEKGEGTSKKSGLYTTDGEEIVPIECSSIDLQGKVCIYTKFYGSAINFGTFKSGAKMLDKSLLDLPCAFNEVQYDSVKNVWLIKDSYMDTDWSIYNPQKQYVSEVKDEGVNLYLAEKYDDVIEYYSKEGISRPWAKFYSGAAMINKANSIFYEMKFFIGFIEDGMIDQYISTSVTYRQTYAAKSIEPDLVEQLYVGGYKMLNTYLEEDTTFKKEAEELMIAKLEYRLEWTAEIKNTFIPLWRKFQQENAAIADQQARDAARRQQQKNELMQAFVGGLMNALSNTITGGQSSPSAYSGKSGTYSASPATTSSSSSKSNNAAKIADWQSRKANYQRQLEKYQLQLIKDPNNAALKHNIRSTEECIRSCDEALSTLR